MKVHIRSLTLGLLVAGLGVLMLSTPGSAQISISTGENLIDFGCVGSDFKVFSNFHLVNNGTSQVRVKSINVPCSCSAVSISDSTLRPGDSVRVRLTFDTKNLYGKTVRSFKINTTDPRTPVLEYAYHSLIGQWLYGLRPEPNSLFFLPTMKSKRVAIQNPALDNATFKLVDQADTLYSIKLLSNRAVKGGKAEIDVVVRDNVRPGTYLSSFRLSVAPSGGHEPFLMTIPIKIVRY